MLYTRKGDHGTTKTLRQKPGQRLNKASSAPEALGTLDELNSLLGLIRHRLKNKAVANILRAIQHNLFVVQAELAGAAKQIAAVKVKEVEKIIDDIEQELPPIKTFFLPGATEAGGWLDYARTVARRAERRVIRAGQDGGVKLSPATMSYLNRLSSLLYALARLSNHRAGVKEEPPTY